MAAGDLTPLSPKVCCEKLHNCAWTWRATRTHRLGVLFGFNAIISLGEKHLHKIKITKNGSVAIEKSVRTGVAWRSLISWPLFKCRRQSACLCQRESSHVERCFLQEGRVCLRQTWRCLPPWYFVGHTWEDERQRSVAHRAPWLPTPPKCQESSGKGLEGTPRPL